MRDKFKTADFVRKLLFLAGITSAITWTAGAEAGILYGVAYNPLNGTSSLSSYDPAMGTLQNSVAVTYAPQGLTSSGGSLYTLANGDSLYEIDPASGTGTPIGDTGLSESGFSGFWSLEFNPVDGSLFLATDYLAPGATGQAIYRINPLTGAATPLSQVSGDASSSQVTALAINSGGSAYIAANDGSGAGLGTQLFQVDLLTGDTTLVGSTGLSGGFMHDLAFDENDVLYGAWSSNSDVYTISTSTGNATFGFSAAINRGLAFESGDTSAVPEPSSIALLGMGGLSLMGCGWRRKRRNQIPA